MLSLRAFESMKNRIVCADALTLLAGFPKDSIDLICTDPPYNGVKDDAWDNQWATDADYLNWLGQLCREWQRVLKPNGSLYVFASPRMAARVEVTIAEYFNVLNSIVWKKSVQSSAEKYGVENFRSFVDMSERIIFAEQHPVWPKLLEEERLKVGLQRAELSKLVTGNSSGAVWNWEAGIRFPTLENWQGLQQALRDLPDYETVERPFSVSASVPYTDVWAFKTVLPYDGKHPTEKPIDLIKHIIKTSSRDGAIVLDCFGGSGATFDACRQLQRDYIGCDISPEYTLKAIQRLSRPYMEDMFAKAS